MAINGICQIIIISAESRVISLSRTIRDETTACKPPFIGHGDLLLTTCTFVIALSLTTTMLAIV